jgi:hypothetical protein
MPIGMAIVHTKQSVSTESSSEKPRRFQMSSVTGLPSSKEIPKSPRVRIPAIHL